MPIDAVNFNVGAYRNDISSSHDEDYYEKTNLNPSMQLNTEIRSPLT